MQWISHLWHWIIAPTGTAFGRSTWIALAVCTALALIGVVIAEASKVRRQALLKRLSPRKWHALGDDGPGTYGLRVELWAKCGVALAVSCSTIIVAVALRVFATPGLTTNVLPALVLVILPFLVGYVVVYRLVWYPRYREQCRRVDARMLYEPAPRGAHGKQKAAVMTKTRQGTMPKINLMPGKAVIAGLCAPFVYYFVAFAPTGNAYHDLHQLGMFVAAPLGYVIGLIVSLGDGIRSGDFWRQRQQA